jgi:hypothetical protein
MAVASVAVLQIKSLIIRSASMRKVRHRVSCSHSLTLDNSKRYN